jgi:hypothetical protein
MFFQILSAKQIQNKHVRYEVFTVVKIMIFFWIWCRVDSMSLYGDETQKNIIIIIKQTHHNIQIIINVYQKKYCSKARIQPESYCDCGLLSISSGYGVAIWTYP